MNTSLNIERNEKNSAFWKSRTVNTLIQGPQADTSTIETFSKVEKFPMSTRMEDITPVVLVKFEFENGEDLKSKVFSTIRKIRILMHVKKHWLSLWLLVCKSFATKWALDEGYLTCSGWEIKIWKSIVMKKKGLSGLSAPLKIYSIDQNERFANWIYPPQTDSLRCRPWLGKSYLWLLRFLSLIIETNQHCWFFLDFRTIRIVMEASDFLVSQANQPLQASSFTLGPWWRTSSQ